MTTLQTAGEGMDMADRLRELVARQSVEIERKRNLMQSLLDVLKLDRHDVEDWPEDSRNVVAAITKELT